MNKKPFPFGFALFAHLFRATKSKAKAVQSSLICSATKPNPKGNIKAVSFRLCLAGIPTQEHELPTSLRSVDNCTKRAAYKARPPNSTPASGGPPLVRANQAPFFLSPFKSKSKIKTFPLAQALGRGLHSPLPIAFAFRPLWTLAQTIQAARVRFAGFAALAPWLVRACRVRDRRRQRRAGGNGGLGQ